MPTKTQSVILHQAASDQTPLGSQFFSTRFWPGLRGGSRLLMSENAITLNPTLIAAQICAEESALVQLRPRLPGAPFGCQRRSVETATHQHRVPVSL